MAPLVGAILRFWRKVKQMRMNMSFHGVTGKEDIRIDTEDETLWLDIVTEQGILTFFFDGDTPRDKVIALRDFILTLDHAVSAFLADTPTEVQ